MLKFYTPVSGGFILFWRVRDYISRAQMGSRCSTTTTTTGFRITRADDRFRKIFATVPTATIPACPFCIESMKEADGTWYVRMVRSVYRDDDAIMVEFWPDTENMAVSAFTSHQCAQPGCREHQHLFYYGSGGFCLDHVIKHLEHVTGRDILS